MSNTEPTPRAALHALHLQTRHEMVDAAFGPRRIESDDRVKREVARQRRLINSDGWLAGEVTGFLLRSRDGRARLRTMLDLIDQIEHESLQHVRLRAAQAPPSPTETQIEEAYKTDTFKAFVRSD